MSALPNRSDLDGLITSNGTLRKHRIKKHSGQTISNIGLVNWVKEVIQKVADPVSIIIIDLYLLKGSDDFEKQQLYLVHLEEAVGRVQAALDELAGLDQVEFDAHNEAASQKNITRIVR